MVVRPLAAALFRVGRLVGGKLPGCTAETLVFDQRGFWFLGLVICAIALHHFPIFGAKFCSPTHFAFFGGARGRVGDVALVASTLAYFFVQSSTFFKLPYERATHNADLRGLTATFGAIIASIYIACGFYGAVSPVVAGSIVMQLSLGAYFAAFLEEAGVKGFGVPGVTLYAAAANASQNLIPAIFGVLRGLFVRDVTDLTFAVATVVAFGAGTFAIACKMTLPISVVKAPATPIPPAPLRLLDSCVVLPTVGVLMAILDASRVLAVITHGVFGVTIPSFAPRSPSCLAGVPADLRLDAGGILPVAIPQLSAAPSLIPSIAVTLLVCVLVTRRLYPTSGAVLDGLRREGLAPRGPAESVLRQFTSSGADVGGILLAALIVVGDVSGCAFGGAGLAVIVASIAAALSAFKQIIGPEVYRGKSALLQMPF